MLPYVAPDKTDLTDEEKKAEEAKKIKNLKGIEYFTALKTLDVSGNALTELDLSKNVELEKLNCSGNKFGDHEDDKDNADGQLNLSQNAKLKTVDCSDNGLTALDVTGCTELDALDCSNNALTTLDVSNNTKLTKLNITGNPDLGSVDVSNVPALRDAVGNENSVREYKTAIAELQVDNSTKVIAHTYTVTFEMNGHGLAPDAQEVVQGDEAKEPSKPVADDDGVEFDTWYQDAELKTPFDFDTKITQDITLYAGWNATVTFNPNGGKFKKDSDKTRTVRVGQTIQKQMPDEPTKSGSKFAGWYTDKELQNEFKADETPITKDVTLYARWEDTGNTSTGKASTTSTAPAATTTSTTAGTPSTGDSTNVAGPLSAILGGVTAVLGGLALRFSKGKRQ